jgi:hypothetical protein
MFTAFRLGLFILMAFNACTVGAEGSTEPTNYEECVAAGNRILKTMPAQCLARNGQVFVQGRADSDAKVKSASATESICHDLCGNDSCEEIVCLGSSCPCPEDYKKCPQDCPVSH